MSCLCFAFQRRFGVAPIKFCVLRSSGNNQRGFGVLPDRHDQEADDDDVRRGRQVQGLVGLHRADHEERGLHVHDEGRRYVLLSGKMAKGGGGNPEFWSGNYKFQS